jgi:hypothetical protein
VAPRVLVERLREQAAEVAGAVQEVGVVEVQPVPAEVRLHVGGPQQAVDGLAAHGVGGVGIAQLPGQVDKTAAGAGAA